MSKSKNDKEFLYAEPDDSDLPYKIYKKREFYYNRVPSRPIMKTYDQVQKYRESVCKLGDDFQPREQQAILPNFINTNTPYKGIILMHGTGSGKSCTAIAVAEQFKEQIMKYNTKIYVLVPGPVTRENFKKELLTCTGDTYLRNKHEFLQLTKEEIELEKRNAINLALQYYKILSYKTFYKKVLGEKIQEKKIVNDTKLKSSYKKTETGEFEREIVVNKISNMDNALLIVDEAHNIIDNEYGDALRHIMKVSKNLKLILLTATPMINLPDEIVSLLNFIRPLDDQIERDKVFTGERNYKMSLKSDGLKYLEEKARGYISFYRGNIPYTFAQRVEKGVIPHGLLFTPVVKCFMDKFQYDHYVQSMNQNTDTLDRGALASANFVFPTLQDNKLVGASSIDGINTLISQVNDNYEKLLSTINNDLFDNKIDEDDLKEFIMINDKKHVTGTFLKLQYIKKFSIKFYKILNRIEKNIEGRKGAVTSFIYSNLVKAGGIELFADSLIQNGYLEYDINNNYDLKDNTKDYKTGLPLYKFKKKYNLSEFKPATFLLVTGGNEEGDEMPEIKQKIIRDVFNSSDNINGKYIKFILGSKVMNEGVTLNNCSQVHILDAFYNIPKAEQVIGRAIRMCVHQASISDENKFPKVYVYRYVVALNHKTDELSTDEILYQKSEIKYLLVKQIERLLKEIAIDCPLLLHANMFPEELEKYKDCEPYSTNMKNPKNMCPALCDFKKCDLKCKSSKLNTTYWDNKNNTYKNVDKKDIDYTTFNEDLSKYEIILIKNKIKDLYRFKYVYVYTEIMNEINKSFLEHQVKLFDTYFLDQALEDLMPKTKNDFNNFKDIIYDKFNRQGYLIKRKKHYIFQPFNEHETLPAYYRNNMTVDIENHVALNNYVKQKFPDIKDATINVNVKTKNTYDFESVLEYYSNREEYDIVGIIDKNTNMLASTENDLFKIRPKQTKQAKKRGTGIHNFKGAVCSNAYSKPALLKIINKLPNILTNELKEFSSKPREDICSIICKKLIALEKYSVNDKKKTYIMIPANHPIYSFPLNLEDRVKMTINKLNKIVGRSVDVLVKKQKDKDNELIYNLTFKNAEFINQYNNQVKQLGFTLLSNEWKLIIN
jgi:superfamily II DNA or RNA helicase